MSVYDISMIIIFLGAIWFGYWKGLAWQVASVAAIVLSYFVAVTFPDMLTPYISAKPPFNRFAAMLILFIGTSLIVWTIFASVSKSLKKMELKGFDHQAGALLGALKGAVLCMVVTMFAVALLGERARDAISTSKSGYYVVSGIDQLPSVLPEDMYAYIHQYLEGFRENMGGVPLEKKSFFEQGNDPQQVNGNSSIQNPPPSSGNAYTPWRTPASQAGYEAPTSGQIPWKGNYQSGTFGNGNTSQQPPYQPQNYGNTGASQWNSGFQPSGANSQNETPWQPPAGQPGTSQDGWSSQFPKITNGEGGWPKVEFNVDSKELLQRGADAAIDAGSRWLERQK